MRSLRFVFLIIGWVWALNAASLSDFMLHDAPAPTFQGDALHLEITYTGPGRQVFNPTLFYRQQGELEFKSTLVRDDGYLLSADIPTGKMHAGKIEYYFAFQSADGRAYTLPETSPETYPMVAELLPPGGGQAQTSSSMEILLLSPEPNESVDAEDFYLAVSLPLETESRTDLKTQLLIGGVDVTRNMEHEGILYSLSAPDFNSGYHNAEFKVFDANGNLLGARNWSFQIKPKISDQSGFNSRTSVFLNNRYQSIGSQGAGTSVNHNDNNFFRGGIQFDGNYNMLDIAARLVFDSEESASRQPLNQYVLNLTYRFSETGNVYAKLGDVYTDYDPLTYWGKRVRGFGAGLNFKYFGVDFTLGKSARAIKGEGQLSNTGTQNLVTRYGTYAQNFMAIRPVFRFGSHVSWGLNLINGKDDPNSIDRNFANNAKESLVMGTTLDMNFDNSNVLFTGSVQASMKNEDATGEIDFDTLASKYDLTGSDYDNAKTFYDLMKSTGFLTVSPGLSPNPSLAMRFQLRMRYLGQALSIGYRKVEANYVTAGNPYLQKDIAGFHIRDNIRLLSNQVFMNLYFRSFDDNISREMSKTNSTDFGASISYFPYKNLPSITLSYNNLARKNELAKQGVDPDTSALIVEDNKTQQIGVSSSYNFELGKVRNTISAGISNHQRDDQAYARNKSDFNMFNIGLRNQFDFPLTTRITFAQTASGFGQDSSKSTTDIQKILVDVQYLWKNGFLNSDVRPFIQFNLQNIKNEFYMSTLDRDYSRTNFATGVYLRNAQYGTFSFRYDHITFGEPYSWSDAIISTRYDITF